MEAEVLPARGFYGETLGMFHGELTFELALRGGLGFQQVLMRRRGRLEQRAVTVRKVRRSMQHCRCIGGCEFWLQCKLGGGGMGKGWGKVTGD